MKKIIIGTRGSKLALWQANFVRDELSKRRPDLTFEVKVIKTEGDARHDLSPDAFGKEGIFTAELDRALTEDSIDIAVHSLKDLPTRLPEGLMVAAVTERWPVADVLILRSDVAAEHGISPDSGSASLARIGKPIKVGTSSLRRIALLKRRFPVFEFEPMRGNLDTRVRKLGEGGYDAIVVAKAGLDRLEVSVEPHVGLVLSPEEFLPAAGQGALALETRDAGKGREISLLLNHPETSVHVRAERAAMSALGAGCRVPAGFLAESNGKDLRLRGVVAHPDGQSLAQAEVTGSVDDPEDAGRRLSEKLLAEGADRILKGVRG